jgi:hypothetical protein
MDCRLWTSIGYLPQAFFSFVKGQNWHKIPPFTTLLVHVVWVVETLRATSSTTASIRGIRGIRGFCPNLTNRVL